MFRRRRAKREITAEPAVQEAPPMRESGPWDADEPHPERERVDLGGLRLPVGEGFEVQLNVAGDEIVGALVLVGDSALQVHAFAAPKSTGIWDEVRTELAAGVKDAGGRVEEREGPFGVELAGKVPVEGQGEQPVRYIGIDGPRWFLRAVLSGKAATDPAAAETLENVIRDIVVVRGEEPMPPKEPIRLRLPAEARQAMEQHASRDKKPDFNPFKRGPEITEIR
ncbi:DUF3710 domain-containing protein [Thermostaphylospora chromogena]|uniref:DUF3710 domain-containing protein n=1 Tax=Thermostaphylospora chromogena TaxID=35622 RepID=A0A1H1HY32_9ACTN|nr:DUF3710 domain-containing protein [Thermostaphylospora chromogena]SDR30381.1 Protein of unknown function [Thermostaphylospora chromogena]